MQTKGSPQVSVPDPCFGICIVELLKLLHYNPNANTTIAIADDSRIAMTAKTNILSSTLREWYANVQLTISTRKTT